mgnify:CR=1 FL=1
MESMKYGNIFVVCGSIQSTILNLERFKLDDFDYIIVDTWLRHVREKQKQEIERSCDEKLEQYYRRFQATQTEDSIK